MASMSCKGFVVPWVNFSLSALFLVGMVSCDGSREESFQSSIEEACKLRTTNCQKEKHAPHRVCLVNGAVENIGSTKQQTAERCIGTYVVDSCGKTGQFHFRDDSDDAECSRFFRRIYSLDVECGGCIKKEILPL